LSSNSSGDVIVLDFQKFIDRLPQSAFSLATNTGLKPGLIVTQVFSPKPQFKLPRNFPALADSGDL
jgi:hypothetical protein